MKPYLGIKHPQLGSIAITGSHSPTLNLHILTELKHFHQNNRHYLFIQPHFTHGYTSLYFGQLLNISYIEKEMSIFLY